MIFLKRKKVLFITKIENWEFLTKKLNFENF